MEEVVYASQLTFEMAGNPSLIWDVVERLSILGEFLPSSHSFAQ